LTEELCALIGLAQFREGPGTTDGMVLMLWHRRETRRQTENTNKDLPHRKAPAYSTKS